MPIKRRILEKLMLTEISGVDKPAHEGATVAIMKRADDPNQQENNMDIDELEGEVADLGARVAYLTKKLANETAPTRTAQTTTSEFDARVTELCKAGASGTEALTQARKEHPDAFEAYRAADVSSRPLHKRAHVSKSVTDFLIEVDRTMIAKRLSRTAAMSDVRKRSPELFESFQEV